jgi:hypothetical protein
MINKIEDFGLNAGKIWKTLDSHGTLTQTNLMKKTKLKDDELYAAIGWLARENKIYYDGMVCRLSETNLTEKTGQDASKVWNTLSKCGDIDVKYIPKLTDIPKKDTYIALGWLACEGKIKTRNVKPKKPQLHFGLK